jgi:hypothetical protein
MRLRPTPKSHRYPIDEDSITQADTNPTEHMDRDTGYLPNLRLPLIAAAPRFVPTLCCLREWRLIILAM